MKSFLDQMRQGWNDPLNKIRREKNKELTEELKNIEKEKEKPFGEAIYSYTEEQATDDGILTKTDDIFPKMPQHLISHITTNLLQSKGYEENREIKRACVLDICNVFGPKIRKIVGKDTFLSGYMESPNGERFKVFAQQNSTGRWTLMLPEDY